MSRLELHLRIRVRPGRRDDFLAFLERAIPLYERPGGITVRVLQRLEDPCVFIEIVEYRDRECYERDQERVNADPLLMERLTEWRTLLDGPAQAETYEVQDVIPTRSASS